MKFESQHSARRIKPRILVVGSSNTDLIIKVAHIPKPGETIPGGEFARAAGGKGANQAVAAARPLPAQLLKRVYLLTPNESEAALLTGGAVTNEATAARAADKLPKRGVQNVVITMGARGAFVAGKDVRQMIPGFKVKAVDTTGAGDVFNGALVVALAEGLPLLGAAQFASAAAAISVTRFGAQPSAPTRSGIQTLLTTGKVLPGPKTRRPK